MKTPVIETNNKFKNLNKTVLLFSGGMDSLIFNTLLKPDVLLYIPSGSNYEAIETLKIKNLADKGFISHDKLKILDDVLNLRRFERDDMIVPNRNAFLILLASMYGETIILCSVSGDRSCDKNESFFIKIQNLLNHMWSEQHWTDERKFRILDPFKDKTKTELVKMFLDAGGSPDALLESYSCYSGNPTPCGACKPCLRRFISFVNNDINIPEGHYEKDPLTAEWIYEFLPKMYKGEYRGAEDADFISALKKLGKI